eukprot:g4147.t1
MPWPFKKKKKVPGLPSSDNGTTVQKIAQLRVLIESGKLARPKRKIYQKLLRKFMIMREKELAARGMAEEDDEKVADVKPSPEVEAKAAKDRRKLEQQDKIARAALKTKIRAMRAKPVKKFACGKECALMLLESGELYQWRNDNPLPVLMNDLFSEESRTEHRLVDKLNAGRFYWTEEELMKLDMSSLETLREELKLTLYSRTDLLSRIGGLFDLGTGNFPVKLRNLKFEDVAASSTQDINVVAKELGLIGKTSAKFLVRAIIKKRSRIDPVIVDVAAGDFHFVAATNSATHPVWSWGRNTNGQLGHGDTVDREFPCPVRTIQHMVEQVCCGNNFTMILTNSGMVMTWGKGDSGQLGHTVPKSKDNPESANPEAEGTGNTNPTAAHLQLVFEDDTIPSRMDLASNLGEKMKIEADEMSDSHPTLHIAAGGTMGSAWSTRWPVTEDLNHFDKQSLEDLKSELEEKMRRLKTAESIHTELRRRYGDRRACATYAELVTCDYKDDIGDGKPRCRKIGDRHEISPKCGKCFGRGYHRDEKLQIIDTLIGRSIAQEKLRKNEFRDSKHAIISVEQELKLLNKELQETKTEKLALEKLQSDLRKQLMNVKKNDNIPKAKKAETLKRVEEEIVGLDVQIVRVSHHETHCATSLDNVRGRLIGMKRSLVRAQKEYHSAASKLLLYERLKIRRQKRLSWNMVVLRDSHARKLIEKAHTLWTRIDKASFGNLFRDANEMNRLMVEYGRKSRDNLENAWIIKLSNHKLQNLMREATRILSKEKMPSRRFEGHAIMGDVIRGWMEYDTKGRPVLYAPYSTEDSQNDRMGDIQDKDMYCHYFQHGECELPCRYGRVHEMMPLHVCQASLQKQGFKATDVDCVEPGESVKLLDSTSLVVSFFPYDELESNMVQKLRLYVDGDGPGQGVQQIFGVMYSQKNEIPGRVLPSAVSFPINITSGQKAGWVDLTFPNPVALPVSEQKQHLEDDPNDIKPGLWIGFYSPHGTGVIRVYGKRLLKQAKRGHVANFEALKSLVITAPPIEFPSHEPLLFRPSIYCETAGLWARLLAMLLDIAQLKIRINGLSLAMTHEKSEKRAMEIANNKQSISRNDV